MAKPIQTPKTQAENPVVTEQPTEAPAPAPAPAVVSKTPKSISSRLVAPGKADGKAPIEAVILGYETKSGWVVSATTFTALYAKGTKREGTRGATAKASDIVGARKALTAIEKAFLAVGWVKPEVKPLGLVRKADEFDLSSLPKPAGKK